ncbi:MAG TPA: biosynthetic-type acetolactate synthase large subunit [Planctomycetota bacterium]|nr:biosynthetic-type acetolactate synthase large subunit [Planctomycetota bacterium]
MKVKGAQILINALEREGVEVAFGYPGGVVIPIFDKLYDSRQIHFYLTRHEQAAAHAADGYARATGKVGVCIATSGPGACNLVTGIATANMDSVPMVAITGQVKTNLIGNDAFQEADITGITRPITKHNYLVKRVEDLARVVQEAFHIARTGRPGPVLVDLPVDVSNSEYEDVLPEKVSLPGYKPNYEGNPRQIERVAEAINAAERPVIYAGGGCIISDCCDELRQLAERAEIPVTNTLLGLGSFPGDHPLSLQMLGMHGTVWANYAVHHADMLISVGARFDDRITGKVSAFAPDAKIVHIDIDPTAISKSIPVDLPIVGDAKRVLRKLLPLIKKRHHPAWLAQIEEWRRKYPLKYGADGLRPQYVVEKIWELTRDRDTVITTEVGQNQMWAAQFYKYARPRSFLSSGGMGTMGFGLPAAIGAQLGRPKSLVIDIAGDGSIQMNIQELTTAVRLKLPVKIALLNNGYLGMVRQWQELFYKKRYSQTDLEDNPDFVKVAEAFGARGIRVTRREDVEPALREAFRLKECVMLDFHVTREENVFPMIPAGEAVDRMIGGMA